MTTTTTQESGQIVYCPEDCPDSVMRTNKYRCGCGKNHKMVPFASSVVHYNGEHWVLECLAKKLASTLATANEVAANQHRRLRECRAVMAGQRCNYCDKPLTRSWKLVCGLPACPHCQADLGGG